MDIIAAFKQHQMHSKSLVQSIEIMMRQDDFGLLFGGEIDATIKRAIMLMASAIEDHANQLIKEEGEPEYHNRQHAFEVMTAMRILIEQEDLAHPGDDWPINAWPVFTPKARGLMLIAALSHDYLHPGGVNQSPYELETRTAIGVERILAGQGLEDEDIFFLKSLILSTDFHHVPLLHAGLPVSPSDRPIDLLLRASILLTEADIMPSIMPEHGRFLAEKLAREWERSHVDRPSPREEGVHQHFLRSVRISSPHAHALKLRSIIDAQLT